jgi:hypothetical protein
MGLSPAQADAAAAQQMGTQQQAADPYQALEALGEDPELAPLRGAFDAMKGELDQLRSSIAQERAQAQAEAEHQALIGELQRMESVIRTSRPDYQEQDIDAIYELSSFYDGDLLKAQQRYENIVGERVQRYLASKGSVASAPANQPVGDGTATTAQPGDAPKTLEDARKEAEAFLKANDQFDF